VSREVARRAGLAFGAFHHFIYDPFKAGLLRRSPTHKLALARAATAARSAYEELRGAAADIRSSPSLRALFAPLTLIADKLSLLHTQLQTGTFAPTDIEAVEADIVQVGSASQASSQPIRELYVAK
jgi:hypothetical protein